MVVIHQLIQRTDAAQSAIDKFYGQPLTWGKVDCAHLVAHTLRALGHRNALKGIGKYTSEIGGLKAMRKAGFENLALAIDALGFEQIGAASCLSADIVAFEGEGFGGWALGIALGDGRLLGFAAGPDGIPICDHAPISVAKLAWRVPI